jgi:hypothetical protein
MKLKLSLVVLALVFSVFLLFSSVPGVFAVGAPSDNMTVPGFNEGEQSQGEIAPPVEHILLGPSLQAQSTPPSVLVSFTGTSGEGVSIITGNESWYLDIDVNADGWVYIYEYFPQGSVPQGRWITYKWQLPESGIWRFGPFVPDAGEAEGQYAYRIWFYSNGQWAGDEAGSQGNMVYWTYSRELPVEQPEPVTPAPEPQQEATFWDKLVQFVSQPLVWSLGLLVIVLLVLGGLYYFRRYRKNGGKSVEAPVTGAEPVKPAESAPAKVNARILLPNNMEIKLDSSSRVIGRDDLARALGRDKLVLISRRHFSVRAEDGQFFIEDLGSANGTGVNGTDIGKNVSTPLNDGDVISLAAATELKFYIV